MIRLYPADLDFSKVLLLGSLIRPSDLLELSGDAYQNLAYATHSGGECWTAMNGMDPLGAFGWTDHGTIWSLWRKLTPKESLAVLQETPSWVAAMLRNSGKPFLFNHVHRGNTPALRWLRRSGCFDIDDKIVEANGLPCYFFRTKSDLAGPRSV